MSFTDIFWLIFLLSTIQPLLEQRTLLARRVHALRQLERSRGSRVITLIHRQENFSFFGLPFARYLDIDDSEQVLRAIELTDRKVPIDLVLHTPGGLVLAAEQIAQALQRHEAKVTVLVPHYAMSGGTLIALAADEILLAPSAVLGPVDPQVGQYAAASILAAVARKDVSTVKDETLVLADLSRKAMTQVQEAVVALLVGHGWKAKRPITSRAYCPTADGRMTFRSMWRWLPAWASRFPLICRPRRAPSSVCTPNPVRAARRWSTSRCPTAHNASSRPGVR